MLTAAKPAQRQEATPAAHPSPASPREGLSSTFRGLERSGIPRYLTRAPQDEPTRMRDEHQTGAASPVMSMPRFLQDGNALGKPQDALEQHARRVADDIVGRAVWPTRVSEPITPRLPALPAHAGVGAGRPLDGATKAFFEPRFGYDFSDMRLHTGAAAVESANAVDARAYTAGRDLVFGAGQFAPATHAGRLLIAHELAHAIQQSRMGPALQRSANTEVAPAPEGAPPQPPDKVAENQPQDQPELDKLKPFWDKDKQAWAYSGIQYREIKGSAVIGDVSPDDVHQGRVGDCYLMAALISLAATRREVIQRAITPDGPGRWKVRLFAKQQNGAFKAITHVVDNMFPATAAGGMVYAASNQTGTKQVSTGTSYVDNRYNDPLYEGTPPADAQTKENFVEVPDADNRELWPAIIEKAYALHAPAIGMVQQGKRSGGYDDIGQGDGSHTALEALTGQPATATDMAMLAGDKLFQRIDAALRAGAPVTAGTPGNVKKRNENLMQGSNIYGNHAYAVLALKGLEITLRNPWGKTYKDADLEAHPQLKSKDDSGNITLTVEAFRKQFDTVYIGASAVTVK